MLYLFHTVHGLSDDLFRIHSTTVHSTFIYLSEHYFLCLQVTPPESMTPRHFHSITATSLGPGLTEVLVFGGQRELGEVPIAETTILRFGEQLLVHVAMATIV